MLDGDRGTAWCEGADGDGAGQSLSFSFRLPPELSGSACAVRDVTLVRGLSRTSKTWSANGRVTAARFESCSRPEDGFDVNLAPRRWSDEPNIRPNVARDAFDAALQEVFFPPGILESERDCVRFVIRAVAPGTKYHDTCISELVPRVYCRTGGASSPSATPLGGDHP